MCEREIGREEGGSSTVRGGGRRRRRWRREGSPHRAALNMNIIMRTGFVVVPLLRFSSSFD